MNKESKAISGRVKSGKLMKRWKNYNRNFSHENTAV